MNFSEDFFKPEVRCGFEISEMMKRAWAAEMEVLEEITRICKKYGLTYYASDGTLLGAVRHGGYIPWDDDLDIEMKWKDYKTLLTVLPEEMPEGWKLGSIQQPEDHNQPFSCLMNSRGIRTDREFLERYHGCPYIVGVDIYPLAYTPGDWEVARAQKTMYSAVYDLAQNFIKIEECGELESHLVMVEELCRIKLDRSKPLRKQLWRLADTMNEMFCEEECDNITRLWSPMDKPAPDGKPTWRWRKEWYEDTIEMPFETTTIPVPVGYDEILRSFYGNYMTPKQTRSSHDYPFYKKQQEVLEEALRNSPGAQTVEQVLTQFKEGIGA